MGRSYKMVVRAGLNNKRSGQISVRTSSSEHFRLLLLLFFQSSGLSMQISGEKMKRKFGFFEARVPDYLFGDFLFFLLANYTCGIKKNTK
jgi:hypothetical protein